mmetsp:Transcript_12740/g.32629  ORF Transcript_12740/g.32629 Transcript_12740/m.32629 type:complete len:202 (+) Transcript_12740:2-607(+)
MTLTNACNACAVLPKVQRARWQEGRVRPTLPGSLRLVTADIPRATHTNIAVTSTMVATAAARRTAVLLPTTARATKVTAMAMAIAAVGTIGTAVAKPARPRGIRVPRKVRGVSGQGGRRRRGQSARPTTTPRRIPRPRRTDLGETANSLQHTGRLTGLHRRGTQARRRMAPRSRAADCGHGSSRGAGADAVHATTRCFHQK